MSNNDRICPRCGRRYAEYPAASRIDDRTEICSPCGNAEAIVAMSGDFGLLADQWRHPAVKSAAWEARRAAAMKANRQNPS